MTLHYDSITYGLNESLKVATVYGISPTSKNLHKITIHEKIDVEGTDYIIKKIAKDAFRGVDGLNTVTIPATIIHIGKYAFAESSIVVFLRENTNKTVYIEEGAFSDCRNLEKVFFNGPAAISEECFNGD